jgi:flagellar M-ring protein FliF
VQNAIAIWQAMDMRRRIIVIGATLGVFLAVLAIGRAATSPDMVLLYAGLEESVAGDVTTALEKRGVQYQVRGGAIYVDQMERDSLRLTLASEGLPGNTGSGYELLDGLSGFGTTSQMFDAAYWRAPSPPIRWSGRPVSTFRRRQCRFSPTRMRRRPVSASSLPPGPCR